MNFGFSEEQELLRATAREFLAREVPMTAVRELLDDPRGYDPAVWAKMAELGWLGLLLPEEYGGAGLTLVDEIVANAPLSVQGTKAILREMAGAAASPEAADRIAGIIQRTNTSADLAEGMRAFLEKRPARFTHS